MTKRVLSGIRATGRLHLGNYLGAVKGMLALQDELTAAGQPQYQTLYMVADIHTITTPYQVEELRQNRREIVIDYLAAGLNPDKSIIFQQADSLHAELAFYLSSVVTVARMQHLPTFKDKVKQHPRAVTMALLNYPVLMAADILIYKAQLVPAGLDQEPHLEVAREIARKMNDQYGLDFPEPRRFETDGQSVPSLTGAGKMSKSVTGSYINLTDDLATITAKLAKVPTDSGQGQTVPDEGGVASLLRLVELFQGQDQRLVYEDQYQQAGLRYGQLKTDLAGAIYQELQPFQTRRQELANQPDEVDQIIADGGRRARQLAEKTVLEVRDKMGLGVR